MAIQNVLYIIAGVLTLICIGVFIYSWWRTKTLNSLYESLSGIITTVSDQLTELQTRYDLLSAKYSQFRSELYKESSDNAHRLDIINDYISREATRHVTKEQNIESSISDLWLEISKVDTSNEGSIAHVVADLESAQQQLNQLAKDIDNLTAAIQHSITKTLD